VPEQVQFIEHLLVFSVSLGSTIMLQAIRYTIRSLRRTPGFTIAALVCLALGVGATAAIFSVVNAVVLRPLPYPDSNRLVRIYTEFPNFPNGGLHKFWMSDSEVFDLQKSAKSFDLIGASATAGVNLAGLNRPTRVNATLVSAEIPKILGVHPLMGRLISKQDDAPGAPAVVMLSYGLWQRVFAGDKQLIGKETTLNNAKATIIAVMPPGFAFPPGQTDATDVWSALQLDPAHVNPGGHNYDVLGRLAPGVTVAQARAEMAVLVAHWGLSASPNHHTFTPKDHYPSLYLFHDEVVGGVRTAMVLLLGAVVLVLMIACVNVMNLLLARSESRQREIAVRRAVGASTFDLAKQFVVEGLILALTGSLLGVGVAVGSLRIIQAANAGSIPRATEIALDVPVLLFTLAVSALIAVLFGLAPFLHVSAIRVFETLKSASGRSSSGISSRRFRNALIIAQMSMAFILLAGADLMIQSFWKLQQVDPGFNPKGLLTFDLSLSSDAYRKQGSRVSFWSNLQQRLQAIPGVVSVTLASDLPPVRREVDNDTEIEGFVPVPNGPIQNVAFYQATGNHFFETLGARLIEGRLPDSGDENEASPGVVINATMARTFWPHQSAIGHRIRPGTTVWCRVVGVVADIKNAGVEKPAGTELFYSYKLDAPTNFNVVIKTAGDPLKLAGAARSVVASLDSTLPLAKVRTMEDVIAAATTRPRFLTLILGMFSMLALCLAAVGIYGVISYSVEQRTSEFGIKMALGAQPVRVLRQVIGQGLSLSLLGIAIGMAGAFLLYHLLAGMLFGISGNDPSASLVAVAVLIVVSTVAALLPGLRAMRVQPVKALRYE
jgi:putative ABC transport system permease protein